MKIWFYASFLQQTSQYTAAQTPLTWNRNSIAGLSFWLAALTHSKKCQSVLVRALKFTTFSGNFEPKTRYSDGFCSVNTRQEQCLWKLFTHWKVSSQNSIPSCSIYSLWKINFLSTDLVVFVILLNSISLFLSLLVLQALCFMNIISLQVVLHSLNHAVKQLSIEFLYKNCCTCPNVKQMSKSDEYSKFNTVSSKFV